MTARRGSVRTRVGWLETGWRSQRTGGARLCRYVRPASVNSLSRGNHTRAESAASPTTFGGRTRNSVDRLHDSTSRRQTTPLTLDTAVRGENRVKQAVAITKNAAQASGVPEPGFRCERPCRAEGDGRYIQVAMTKSTINPTTSSVITRNPAKSLESATRLTLLLKHKL